MKKFFVMLALAWGTVGAFAPVSYTHLDVRMNIPRIEAEMCAAAEKAVENIPGVRLPDFYLEGLDRELDLSLIHIYLL